MAPSGSGDQSRGSSSRRRKPNGRRRDFAMNNLRNQMEALAQGIASSARERNMAVGDSKLQTAMMLQAFGLERMAMAKDLKSRFAADHASRLAIVHTMRANAGKMCEGFFRDHARMRRSLQQRLAKSTEAVASSVVFLRADFAKGRADFAKAHRHMTKAHRAGLAKDRRDRSREVAELTNDFQVSRREMAQELAESLARSTQEIKSQVSGLSRFGASLQKIRENAWDPRQIPNSLLAAQAGGAASVPISAPSREPEKREKKEGQEKTSFGESLRHFVGKPGKPKKK